MLLPRLRQDPPVYAECPACHLVTAPVWQVRDAARPGGWPALVGCGFCGHEHRVGRDGAHRPGALVRHHCGTTVACPATADLVRCHGRGPGGLDGGCGDLFAGPAAQALVP